MATLRWLVVRNLRERLLQETASDSDPWRGGDRGVAISRVSSSEYASASPTTADGVDLPPWIPSRTGELDASSSPVRLCFVSVYFFFLGDRGKRKGNGSNEGMLGER